MKRFAPLLLVVALLAFGPAFAQEATPLKMLRVALWPEYDDPRLLVIIDGALPQAGQTVRFPIPADAQINAVATSGADGSLLNAEWNIAGSENGFQIISLLSDGDRFRIEYYAAMKTTDARRDARFDLPAGYVQADQAIIEALLPPGSEEISSDPPLQSAGAAPDNAPLFVREVGALSANSDLVQNISYNNPTGAWTNPASAPAPAPPQPAPPATQAAAPSPNYIVWGLGGLAVILIIGGLVLLWRSGREDEFETVAPAVRARKKGKAKGAETTGRDRFCRQCGAKFAESDRFCRQCGARRL
ncbi:MAG: zinc ribbon domain-containing protein [Chloroflexi bacterium]|nr:zinc ribbon domain-containing protein [Chloroflexota bacterium]